MKALRIIEKVLGWFIVAVLALQAVLLFNGASMDSGTFGAESILFAISILFDTLSTYEKPKHPFLRWSLRYKDGTESDIIVRADAQYCIPASHDNPITELGISYFESDKDEVKNEQKN